MAKKIIASLLVLFASATGIIMFIAALEEPHINDLKAINFSHISPAEVVTFSYTLPTDQIPSTVRIVGSRFGIDWSILCDTRFPDNMYNTSVYPQTTYECKATVSRDWRNLPYNVELEYPGEEPVQIRYYVMKDNGYIFTWGSFDINGYSMGYPACWRPNGFNDHNVVASGC